MKNKNENQMMIDEFKSVVLEAKKLHEKYGVSSSTDDLVLKTLQMIQMDEKNKDNPHI